ncbi:putative S-adenosyl-L-methionine-dependent methyltransferase [Mycolicibacterium insubricum]|uniref:S-adenosyl-L-methionine-dependent methyltransferase n=1 Tax=Mycolicibacterium insubricum TaxID=444597 RepID=A0A1X0DCI3_9MYCO|nr:class I SAM-dependent methyltransferase [Mycolicibacterium insubricum]ORA69882.1 SAM-dependent methyltransferase [Mycolicibacterium insubricum]BBZ65959.1 putative S-adenosyl-L-methionine-dependent methyltransferase [Mycolicibacterium insubricum]
MARTDNDSWDLASSVGATATMVALGRALSSREPDALIDDPFAEPLVRAVGIEFFTKVLDGDIDPDAFPNASPERARAMIDGMAVRTKFFDDYFTAAADAGIRQVVILASGLDSRAYRLDWPAGTVVYEIDQPDVITFKSRVLDELGAGPRATRRTVAIDLREDWPAALTAAGFDPSAPTAWLAEGLLIYLPPAAQDALFDTITALSAPGSAAATEYVPGIFDFDEDKARESSAVLREHGLDLDMTALIYPGQRSHVMDYLSEKGWQVTGVSRTELFTRHGLALPPAGEGDALGEIVYVSATTPG